MCRWPGIHSCLSSLFKYKKEAVNFLTCPDTSNRFFATFWGQSEGIEGEPVLRFRARRFYCQCSFVFSGPYYCFRPSPYRLCPLTLVSIFTIYITLTHGTRIYMQPRCSIGRNQHNWHDLKSATRTGRAFTLYNLSLPVNSAMTGHNNTAIR